MYRKSQFLALLQGALAQPVEDREAFIYAFSGDMGLAREVIMSLEEIDNFEGFLDQPVVAVLAEAGLL